MVNQKFFPLLVFIVFCAILFGATLYYAPGWGFMDDAANLEIANRFWGSVSPARAFLLQMQSDRSNGRFRPLYQLWIIFVYRIFSHYPLGLYILITIIGVAMLLVWGMIIQKSFSCYQEDYFFNVFVFPLSFFIFTPFWNNFMYISIQEKFVYIFSALSIFFFLKGYERRRIVYLILSWILMIIGFMGKETGAALAIAYIVYSLLDAVIFKEDRRLSLIQLIANTLILGGYYIFIRRLMTNYTLRYNENLGLSIILQNVLSGPNVLRMLIFLAFAWLIGFTCFFFKNKEKPSTKSLIFPLYFISYALALSPWGFTNYLLAPIAPLVMGMLFPFYYMRNKNSMLKGLLNICLIILCFSALFYVVLPRISKMADKKKLVEFVIGIQNTRGPGKYFFPLPFEESAIHFQKYTNTDLTYLARNKLNDSMLIQGEDNFLVFGDECLPLTLENVGIEKEIYRNSTWRIFLLKKEMGSTVDFKVDFPKNIFDLIKDRAYKKGL